MMQNNDVPEILLRLEGMNPHEIDVQDCRELSQKFQELNQSGSPFAARAKELLRKILPLFSPDQLRIQ